MNPLDSHYSGVPTEQSHRSLKAKKSLKNIYVLFGVRDLGPAFINIGLPMSLRKYVTMKRQAHSIMVARPSRCSLFSGETHGYFLMLEALGRLGLKIEHNFFKLFLAYRYL